MIIKKSFRGFLCLCVSIALSANCMMSGTAYAEEADMSSPSNPFEKSYSDNLRELIQSKSERVDREHIELDYSAPVSDGVSLMGEGGEVTFAGEGTEESPYLITNRDELSAIGDFAEKKYFKIANDITLDSEELWLPVSEFNGVLDGDGKTISGLVIQNDDNISGLIGVVATDAEVKNLILTDVDVSGKDLTGSICATLHGSISDCAVSGVVSGEQYVGGLIGWVDIDASIANCDSSVNVIGSRFVGGLVGFSTGASIESSHSAGSVTVSPMEGLSGDGDGDGDGEVWCIGGFMGELIGTSVDDCSSSGAVTVTGEGAFETGGFVGFSSNSEIYASSASGDVEVNAGIVEEIGGFTGYSNVMNVDGCTSSGAVTVTGEDAYEVGGFSGSLNNSTFEGCYASGNIAADGFAFLLGGFAGNSSNSDIANCYASGDIASEGCAGYIGGFIGACDSFEDEEDDPENTMESCGSTGAIRITYNDVDEDDLGSDGEGASLNGIGGFAGYIQGWVGAFDNCYSTGEIEVSQDIEADTEFLENMAINIGGFAGVLGNSDCVIEKCYYEGGISSEIFSLSHGGFIGYNISGSDIENCYSIANIDATGYSAACFGGAIFGSDLSNCYAVGEVTGAVGTTAGFVGTTDFSTFTNCRSDADISTGNVTGGFASYIIGDCEFNQCSSQGSMDINIDDSVILTDMISFGGFYGVAGNNISGNNMVENCYTDCDIAISIAEEIYEVLDDGTGDGTGDDEPLPTPVKKYIGGFGGLTVNTTVKCSYSANTITVNKGEDVTLISCEPFANQEAESGNLFEDCFYDFQVIGSDVNAASEIPGISGCNTADMKTEATFTDATWDFEDIWGMYGSYPCFKKISVSGKVYSINNNLIAGADVSVLDNIVTSDSDGNYDIALDRGYYKIKVPFKSPYEAMLLVGDENITGNDLRTDCIIIEGDVDGVKTGKVVRISLRNRDVHLRQEIVSDGSDLEFRFNDIDPGQYTITATCDGYGDDAISVTVTDSDIINNHLSLEKITSDKGSSSRSYGGYGTSVSSTPVQPAKRFLDLGGYDWAREAIDELAEIGVINGTTPSAFSPGNQVTRADFIVMLVRAFGFTGSIYDNFSDVPSTAYYYNQVSIAKELGLALGVNGNEFKPLSNITRQDMMVLIVRALKLAGVDLPGGDLGVLARFADSADISDYARQDIATLVQNNLILGSGSKLNPRGNLTRAEAAVIIHRILKLA